MKKLQSIVLMVLVLSMTHIACAQKKKQDSKTTTVAAQNNPKAITWMSITDALKQNEGKNKKKIFVDVYTDWCGWCKRMDATTFQDSNVIRIMNKYFYAVKFNAESKDTIFAFGQKLANQNPTGKGVHDLAVGLLNGQMSYPSYSFLNEDNKLLTVVPGYQQADAFEKILVYFGNDDYLKYKWEEYSAIYDEKIKPFLK